FGQRGRRAFDAEALRQGACRVLPGVADRDDLDEVQLGERGEMVPGDVAGADDGDPQPAGVGRNEGSGQLVHVVAGCGRWKCSSRVETTLSTRRSQVWSETAATRSSAA